MAEPSGAVSTSTSPKVQYAYSEMPSGANHSRLTSMTYPNARVITSNYASGLDADISRLSELKDGSTVLEGYSYLGLGTVVKRAHPQSGVDLSFVKLSGESVGDAGDQYTGLDRFRRITDQRWMTAANGVAVDRYQYSYDRNGNRTAETNSLNSNLNETYGYDSLNQLTNFSTTGNTKSWDFDALGNWDGVTTNGTTQTRTHNRQNEITAVSGQTSPVFDANGNMTTDETGKQYVYDAWNRLKIVKNSGGTTLVTYAYDPLTRRVQEVTGSTRDLYYSSQWQLIEETVGGTPRVSYVWSPVYVDAMVARDFDSDSNGSLEQRLYPTHDANFNVTALVNTSGTVVERYTYDPFGTVTVRNSAWTVATPAYGWQYFHQGGRLNVESGLYSFRYREYSPTLGRWVTIDPLMYIGGANAFGYVRNNPMYFIDPLGLVECNKDNAGARRAVLEETVFSPGDKSPDYVKGALNFAIVLAALADLPLPTDDIADLISKKRFYWIRGSKEIGGNQKFRYTGEYCSRSSKRMD
jgi:RHS repeat-associated protein